MIQPTSFLAGELVRLIPFSADRDPISYVRWNRNSDYLHLSIADSGKQYSLDNIKKWFEENVLSDDIVYFMIQTVNDERIIGNINLEGFKGNLFNAFVGISIGDPNDWGKDFGTEAMKLILRYGFEVLNLHRISLTVFEYNLRAIRSYEKAGFRVEGQHRKWVNRDGKRWDMISMGIMQSEWREDVN